MRSPLFHRLYRTASPFMRKPSDVAEILTDLIISNNIMNGSIYNLKRREKHLPEIEKPVQEAFWKESYSKIESFTGAVFN